MRLHERRLTGARWSSFAVLVGAFGCTSQDAHHVGAAADASADATVHDGAIDSTARTRNGSHDSSVSGEPDVALDSALVVVRDARKDAPLEGSADRASDASSDRAEGGVSDAGGNAEV